ncbi:MAG: hypothetical protein WBG22_14155, partial [Rhodanobacter sp.]
PEKNWKFSLGDVAERKYWDRYQAAYQDMIRHTASAAARTDPVHPRRRQPAKHRAPHRHGALRPAGLRA